MIPAAFVVLEFLPLTPNGKVDRRALPTPEMSTLASHFTPPRNAVELQLTQIWEEILNVGSIGIQDNFFELGGHSLLAVSLMARIQQQFGKKLSLAVLFERPTIEHLANLIGSSTDSRSSSALIPLQPNGSKRPFFCVHPGGGTVVAYLELARYLDPERPFYGLESVDQEHKLYTKVEDMAAYYIEVMKTAQPQGPYILGGWSFGGLVAFEMAQQLLSQGEKISLLALLDTYPFTEYEELNEEDDAAFLKDFFARNNGAALNIAPELELAQAQRLLQVFKSHVIAANNYTPQPYPGKVALFLAEDGIAVDSDDPILGWDKLAIEGAKVQWVPGDHHTMLTEPNVKVLAEKLRVYLEELQKMK
jgi:thioesterase domain-containing protein/acyl carrier protein